jgi:hypothetical protein
MADHEHDVRSPQPRAWLKDALSEEFLFGDSEPTWAGCLTSSEARKQRLTLVKLLERNGATSLALMAEELSYCAPKTRCRSGACPECGRALQRLFVHNSQLLLNSSSFCAVSVIDTIHSCHHDLQQISVDRIIARTKKILREAGVGFACGGVDLSFNEDQLKVFEEHWCAHLWLFLPSHNRSLWEQALREANIPNNAIPRPVFIKTWDQSNNALAYALKNNFYRRQRILNKQLRNDTSQQRLRVKERLSVTQYLYQSGLHARIFLLGVRPTTTENGIAFVRLKKTVKSEKSTRIQQKKGTNGQNKPPP